ncbi:unnamed protein product, partial [Candidula unifasciata]
MASCTKSRGCFQSIVVFILGLYCGHEMWNRVRPSVDTNYRTCQTASFNKPEFIRKRLASPGIRTEPPGKDISNTYEVASTEDDTEDNFLFVGIMTARKFLESRAFASSQTWVPRVPGKVYYFLGEGENYTGPLNVIQLKGVKENDYPPQKKSFAMVEYMSQHFAKHYKWLIRADDDVYMKVDELVKFLKSVNDSYPRYIGQPGFGKAVEAGKLGLAGAFCMGGPGVIMTPKVVMGVAPGLKDCLGLTVTGHEDTELGRCITINTGVQCTTAFEMKELFYQNYAELDMPNSSFKKNLGKDEIRAVTLHPVKEGPYVFRVDNFFNNLTLYKMTTKKKSLLAELNELDRLIKVTTTSSLKQRLADSSQPIEDNYQMDTRIFTEAAFRRGGHAVNLENIRRLPKEKSVYQGPDKSWEFIRYKRMFSTTFETGKLEFPLEYKRRAQLHSEMTSYIKTLPENVRYSLTFVNETYHRLSTSKGVETLLFLKKWVKNNKYVQPYYLRKPLLEKLIDFREADEQDEEMGSNGKTIYMLMPLYQRSAIYRRFLEMYATTVGGYNGKVELRVVMFTDDRGEHKLMSAMTYSLLGKHPQLDIRITYLDEPFNRGKGLMTAMSDLPYNSLLLFMDVDMEFSSMFLHRVSKYTVMGKSTFFPIYFVHFNPESICYRQDDCDSLLESRRDEVGLWRSFSYGIGAVYKKDLIR